MNITLRNIKHSAFASHETNCFEATVYVDGKKSGTAWNDGQGGGTSISPRELEARIEAYAATLPPQTGTIGEGRAFEFQPRAESIIDDLVVDYLIARDLKRDMAKKIVYLKDGQIWVASFKTAAGLAAWMSNPARKLPDGVPDGDVLNLMPFDRALAVYKRHA